MVKQKEKPKKTFSDIFKEYNAQFSMSLSDGFANIDCDEKGEWQVKFLNDEGYFDEDSVHDLQDIKKVANFMEELKNLRLQDYKINP